MDIVERLGELRLGDKEYNVVVDAIDEIEQLRSSKMLQLKLAEIKQTELDRLREALKKIGYGTGIITADNHSYFFHLIDIARAALKDGE